MDLILNDIKNASKGLVLRGPAAYLLKTQAMIFIKLSEIDYKKFFDSF